MTDDAKHNPDIDDDYSQVDIDADEHDFDENSETPIEIDDEISQVASPPAKNVILIAVLVIGAILFLYNTIFKETPEQIAQKEVEELIASQPEKQAIEPTDDDERPAVDIGIVETPSLPNIGEIEPPPIEISSTLGSPEAFFPDPFTGIDPEHLRPAEPTPSEATNAAIQQPVFEPQPEFQPEPEPEPQPQPQQNVVQTPIVESAVKDEEVANFAIQEPTAGDIYAKRLAIRRGEMLKISGGGSPDNPAASPEDNTLDLSSAERTSATTLYSEGTNTNSMILQGKILDAVLETALNSDLKGDLRAILSHNVYAETGRRVLLNKGSRLIGSYQDSVERGQKRIEITWNRVIDSSQGLDIALQANATDRLGRTGLTGQIDNKYFEVFSNSLLISVLTIGGSLALEKAQENQTTSTSTTNTDGSTTATQSGSPSDFAVLGSIRDLTDKATEIGQDLLDADPTIFIPQGTIVKVFVNKDIVFPSHSGEIIR